VKRLRVGYLVGGHKGASFLAAARERHEVAFVSSFRMRAEEAYREIRERCERTGDRFVPARELEAEHFRSADLTLVVGWQFLLDDRLDTLVVLHDSLLPRHRGFAPTVSALIEGDPEIGVTAFRPVPEVDAGPVYAQARRPVRHPIRIADAYRLVTECYLEAAERVCDMAASGSWKTTEQDHARATYSLWRGPEDTFVDWSDDAARIVRFVHAVGAPYPGARTRLEGRTILLREVEEIPDLAFHVRHPGKFWKLDDGRPEVVCGRGMVRILEAVDEDGHPVAFERLRTRLG